MEAEECYSEDELSRGETDVGGEAIRVFEGEDKEDFRGSNAVGGYGELGKEPVFVFELEGDVFGGKEVAGFAEDGREFAGGEAVVAVRADPCLELADFGSVRAAATVNEVFAEAGDFRDVEGDGHLFAAGKQEAEGLAGMEQEQRL